MGGLAGRKGTSSSRIARKISPVTTPIKKHVIIAVITAPP